MSRKRRAAPPANAGEPLVVSAGDHLDIEAAERLLQVLRQALDALPGTQHEAGAGLTVDLGGAEVAHTAALQILIASARACSERGHPFALAGVGPALGDQLYRCGLAETLGLADASLPGKDLRS